MLESLDIICMMFCRLGTIVMLCPGVSNARIPMRLRLWFAIACCVVVFPAVAPAFTPLVRSTPEQFVQYCLIETLIGGAIGLLIRFTVSFLEFFAGLAAATIGLAGVPGVMLEDMDSSSVLAPLINLIGLIFLFAIDAHHSVIRALHMTYESMPIQGTTSVEHLYVLAVTQWQMLSEIALQMVSPLILYALAVNLSLAFLGRWTPQLQTYFLGVPIVIGGGIWLLASISETFLSGTGKAFSTALTLVLHGGAP